VFGGHHRGHLDRVGGGDGHVDARSVDGGALLLPLGGRLVDRRSELAGHRDGQLDLARAVLAGELAVAHPPTSRDDEDADRGCGGGTVDT
jgi:hypothetical protein